jgi:hypothetical protein
MLPTVPSEMMDWYFTVQDFKILTATNITVTGLLGVTTHSSINRYPHSADFSTDSSKLPAKLHGVTSQKTITLPHHIFYVTMSQRVEHWSIKFHLHI